jgi:hypothetical protein
MKGERSVRVAASSSVSPTSSWPSRSPGPVSYDSSENKGVSASCAPSPSSCPSVAGSSNNDLHVLASPAYPRVSTPLPPKAFLTAPLCPRSHPIQRPEACVLRRRLPPEVRARAESPRGRAEPCVRRGGVSTGNSNSQGGESTAAGPRTAGCLQGSQCEWGSTPRRACASASAGTGGMRERYRVRLRRNSAGS